MIYFLQKCSQQNAKVGEEDTMADNKGNEKNVADVTGYINTEELRDILKEEEKEKKLPWYKRIFNKNTKKEKKK